MDPIRLTYEQKFMYYWSREGSRVEVNICVKNILAWF